ncbi:MAG: RNA polymerase factor sigma-54 [Muribaculaceae bacterium]|nr:RNA polymerase factor sigma-54 [Muribaculaceae bacterium]
MEKSRQNIVLEQRLSQRLTQQHFRFVKMLEMSAPELDDEVEREMEANPALEAVDADTYRESEPSISPVQTEWNATRHSGSSADYAEIPIADSAPSLYDSLLIQLGQLHLDPDVLTAARFIVGNLDSNGRLQRDPAFLVNDLAFSEGIDLPQSVMDKAFGIVRTLEPHGVGAISLADCLSIQLEYLPPSQTRDDALRILNEQYEAFSMLHTHLLVSRLKISQERVTEAIDLIRTLNPKPGASVESAPAGINTIIPDVIIDTSGSEPVITLNNRIPELRISEAFSQAETDMKKRAEKLKDNTDREFILNRYNDARDFIRSLQLRQQAMMSVVTAIVKLQREYFDTEDVYRLRPMMIKDIEKLTGQDASVISRCTANKYVALPWGILPLRFFFSDTVGDNAGEEETDALTNRKIEAEIRRVVDAEDKKHPLSDEKITQTLLSEGLNISRRTVAKYRDRLGIAPARLRKKI